MDFSSEPKGLSEWLICAACALWMAGLAIDLVKKLKGKEGQPPNEQLGENLQELKDELQARRREEAVLHSRITDLAREVSRIEGKMSR